MNIELRNDKKMEKKYDLEDRLIDFGVLIIKIAEKIGNTISGKLLGENLIRSGTSPAFNYGEAQGAESRRDFIHKMKICLKELRETRVGLKFLKKLPFEHVRSLLDKALPENEELISIFVKSIETAQINLKSDKGKR